MPKEKIADIASPGWRVELSWRPRGASLTGHVQIATVNPDSPFEFPEKDTGDSCEAAELFDGWRITLDEEGLNALIRAAHKANTQAFGSWSNGNVDVLIAASKEEVRRYRRENPRRWRVAISVSSDPATLDGCRVGNVHITPAAAKHPKLGRALAVMRRNMRHTPDAGEIIYMDA